MQIKKEEIRTTILNAAQQEFLTHGYEGSSLRVIAKKQTQPSEISITILTIKRQYWKN